MSPEFGPYSGTADQSLSMEWDLRPYEYDEFDPSKGTFILDGPYIMIAASGCEQYHQSYNGQGYQWDAPARNQAADSALDLTLPIQGERAPQIEPGGKLHWTGQQSLSATTQDPEDPTSANSAFFWTAVWTYDLTYDPGRIEKCSLTAAIPQKVANALKARVNGGTTGCLAKVTAVKYKVGNKVFSLRGKKPQKRVAAGGSGFFLSDEPIVQGDRRESPEGKQDRPRQGGR